MSTISGTWSALHGPATPAGAPHRHKLARLLLVMWRTGLTRWGRPPRDDVAHRRKLLRRLVLIAVGYGLLGAGVLRIFLGET